MATSRRHSVKCNLSMAIRQDRVCTYHTSLCSVAQRLTQPIQCGCRRQDHCCQSEEAWRSDGFAKIPPARPKRGQRVVGLKVGPGLKRTLCVEVAAFSHWRDAEGVPMLRLQGPLPFAAGVRVVSRLTTAWVGRCAQHHMRWPGAPGPAWWPPLARARVPERAHVACSRGVVARKHARCLRSREVRRPFPGALRIGVACYR